MWLSTQSFVVICNDTNLWSHSQAGTVHKNAFVTGIFISNYSHRSLCAHSKLTCETISHLTCHSKPMTYHLLCSLAVWSSYAIISGIFFIMLTEGQREAGLNILHIRVCWKCIPLLWSFVHCILRWWCMCLIVREERWGVEGLILWQMWKMEKKVDLC